MTFTSRSPVWLSRYLWLGFEISKTFFFPTFSWYYSLLGKLIFTFLRHFMIILKRNFQSFLFECFCLFTSQLLILFHSELFFLGGGVVYHCLHEMIFLKTIIPNTNFGTKRFSICRVFRHYCRRMRATSKLQFAKCGFAFDNDKEKYFSFAISSLFLHNLFPRIIFIAHTIKQIEPFKNRFVMMIYEKIPFWRVNLEYQEYLQMRKIVRTFSFSKCHHVRCSFSVIQSCRTLKKNHSIRSLMAVVHFHFSMLSLVCLRIGM